jgi:RND family efflux transporter MFP subunit
MTRWGITVCCALLLIGNAVSPASGQEAKNEDAEKPASATPGTHKVTSERLKIEVNLTGVFEAQQTWPIALQPKNWSSFTVVKAVPHGTRVKRGDTLVQLDMTKIDEQLQDLEHARQLSRLSQRLAETEWSVLQKTIPLDLTAAQRAQRIANEDLSYFMKTDRAYQQASAEFSLKSSQNSLEYAEEELQQLEKMYSADDLTEETEEIILKRARNDVERAKFYLQGTGLRTAQTLETELPREEQQLVDAAKRADLALAKAEVELPVKLEKQKVERLKQQLEEQRAVKQLNELRQDRAMMEVKAPADGYVYHGSWTDGKWSGASAVASQLKQGGKLAPHSVFMTIVNPRPLVIRVDVPEKDLYRLTRNLPTTATPDGYPELELQAALQQVAPFPMSQGTFEGRFAVILEDEARPIVPGMGCKLTVVAYNNPKAITVPAKAVFEDSEDGKRNVVYLQRESGPAEKRKVVVGQKTENKWEIVRGLQAGDEILLTEPAQN